MTEITNSQNGPSSAQFSPSQIETMRADWTAHGLDAAKFDAALAGNPAHAPSNGAEVEKPETNLGTARLPSLTPAQMAIAADDLRRAGVSEEKIQAALAADGFIEAPETRSAEQVEHDASFGMDRAYLPADYPINYREAIERAPGGGMMVTPDQLSQFNNDAQSFLAGMNIPPEIGVGLVERAVHVGQAYNAMSAAEKTLFKAEQTALLERQAGSPEKAKEMVRQAGVALKRAPGSFRDTFFSSGAAHDAYAVRTLANFGAHIEKWQASRPAK